MSQLPKVAAFSLSLLLLVSMWVHVPAVFAVDYSVTISIDSVADAAGCRVLIDGVSYSTGDVVSLSEGTHTCSVTAPSNWDWLEWVETTNCQVADPDSASTTLTVSGDGEFSASWGPIVTFTTSPSDGGTIRAGLQGQPSTRETYSNGQSDTMWLQTYSLDANPSSGYEFTSWSSAGCGNVDSSTSASTTWTPTGPGTMTAIFTPEIVTYDVTISIASAEDDAGAGIRIDGTVRYNGDVVSLSEGLHTCEAATPSGWGWLSWVETTNTPVTNPSSSSTTFTVNGDGVLGADWGPIVTFYTSPKDGGTVSVYYWGAPSPFTATYSNKESGIIEGFSSTLIANPAAGYAFSSWSSTGSMSISSATSSPTSWNPTGPGAVTANFSPLQQVATPTFSPAGGTYTSPIVVSIACSTSGATIRYTTDGADPTTSSTVYTSPIAVSSGSVTIKTRAFKSGMLDSEMASATYTIEPPQPVATPTFSPAGGTYIVLVSVSIECATPGAAIRYTTDGTLPTSTSPLYTGSIGIITTTTIWARAFKTGLPDSDVASATYTITPRQQVATPILNLTSGTYKGAQSVRISCSTPGALIRYTTNGVPPTTSSPLYSTPITVSSSVTLMAQAFLTDWYDSELASATYTIITQAVAPIITPSTSEYAGPVIVTIVSPDGFEATIRFTVDGTTPTSSSEAYTDPGFIVDTTTTIRARAYMEGLDPSTVAVSTITIGSSSNKIPTPMISPPTDTYPASQLVNISCSVSPVTIRYTTDGTQPTTTSPLYRGPFEVRNTTTVKAIAFGTGWTASNEAYAVITIDPSRLLNPPSPPILFAPSQNAVLRDPNVAFSWMDEDGVTSYQIEITGPSMDDRKRARAAHYVLMLSPGTYSWRVRAHSGAGWSKWSDARNFTIELRQPSITECTTMGTTFQRGDTVPFIVTVYNPGPSSAVCWIKIRAVGAASTPSGGVVTEEWGAATAISVNGSELNTITIYYQIPDSQLPMTIQSVGQLYLENPDVNPSAAPISSVPGAVFMIDDPDVSYVEVLGVENHRIIHLRIMRHAYLDPETFDYFQYVTMCNAIGTSYFNIGNFAELLLQLPDQYQRTIPLSLDRPYDVTIVQVYNRIGIAFEATPIDLFDEAAQDLAVIPIQQLMEHSLIEMLNEYLGLALEGIPLPPLDTLYIVDPNLLDSPVPSYEALQLPVNVNLEHLAPLGNHYGRDGVVDLRIKISDPQTGTPISGYGVQSGDLHALIMGPNSDSLTQPMTSLTFHEVDIGVYSSQIRIAQLGSLMLNDLASVPTGPYSTTFYFSTTGFFGVSPIGWFTVDARYDGMSVHHLEVDVADPIIGAQDTTLVTVSFDVTTPPLTTNHLSIVLKEHAQVEQGDLWLDNTLGTQSAPLLGDKEQLAYTFTIQGSDLGQGNHKIYAIVTLTSNPLGSALPGPTITRQSYQASITVPSQSLVFSIFSPINLLVTDPIHRRVGFDPTSNSIVNEIPDVVLTIEGLELKVITIPNPLAGIYSIDVIGTGSGQYTITVKSVDADGQTVDSKQWTGQKSAGTIEQLHSELNTDGRLVKMSPSFISLEILILIVSTIVLTGFLLIHLISSKRKRRTSTPFLQIS